MNSLNPVSIVRQKAIIEKVFELPMKSILSFPREDSKDNLYVCNHIGEIIKFKQSGEYEVIPSSTGQPVCIAFNSSEEDIGGEESKSKEDQTNTADENYYLADIANACIYEKKEDKYETVIQEYNGHPLIGPSSLSISTEDNIIFFCDAGYMETTSLSRSNGSLYVYDIENNITIPLLSNCLAYPSDVFYDNLLGVGYVAEMYKNRILKISRNPLSETNVFQISVFYCFNGRIGPSSITCDDEGNVYVSRYEYQNKDGDVDGLITVISKEGQLLGELIVPKLPEITGMYIPRKEEHKDNRNDIVMYLTERNFSGVLKIKLGQFIIDIDKVLDNLKAF